MLGLPGALLTRRLSASFNSRRFLILLKPDEDIGRKQGTHTSIRYWFGCAGDGGPGHPAGVCCGLAVDYF